MQPHYRLTQNAIPYHLVDKRVQERGDGYEFLDLEGRLLFIDFNVVQDSKKDQLSVTQQCCWTQQKASE